uniref:Signaling protein n=1 Tax=Clostridioides difficile TaxID=1496 RepID=A0A381I6Q2_CLODI|nr:signaling protein [Clostridioides difficile]
MMYTIIFISLSCQMEKVLSISMGVVIAKPGQEYDELYQIADNALYDSKRQGRNRFKIV